MQVLCGGGKLIDEDLEDRISQFLKFFLLPVYTLHTISGKLEVFLELKSAETTCLRCY